MPGLLLAAGLFEPIKNPNTFVLAILLSTAVFVAVMAALHQLAPVAKKWLSIVCTFLAGLYFLLEFFWPITTEDPETGSKVNFITPTVGSVTTFVTIMFAWMIGLGLISLALVHGRRLLKRHPNWHHSLAFFLALIAMLFFGGWTQAGTAVLQESGADHVASLVYTSLLQGLLYNLDAAMFSLLAFYIASAAYRAFRVRTVESGLLMLSAFIVMLGFVNFGVWITSAIPIDSPWAFFRVESLSAWTLQWMNMPAYRAVVLGVEVGALAMAMRLWLSLERGAFFSQE